MPTIWTFVRAAAVLVGSSAALLTGGIAHADPAPAPAPAPNIPQQLISSAANAPQILQNLATAAKPLHTLQVLATVVFSRCSVLVSLLTDASGQRGEQRRRPGR